MRNERGFTQLELIIGISLLSVVTGGILALASTSVDSYRLGVTRADVERMAVQAVDRITEELVMTGADVLSPVPTGQSGSDRVSYQRNDGWDDDAVSWGSVNEFRLVADPNDPDDGKDNNGNGLIDEKQLEYRLNVGTADERVVVLTRWVRELLEGELPNGKDDNANGLVDEPGFSLTEKDGLWTIFLTLERHDVKGRLATYTVETAVRPRN